VDTRQEILRLLKELGEASGVRLAAALGLSRQAVNRHLARLIDEGKLVMTGRTRGAAYRLATRRGSQRPPAAFRGVYPLAGLQEDAVVSEASLRLNLRKALSAETQRIFAYALSEMLNNASEHSASPTCLVEVRLMTRELQAVVRDQGVGVFHSIAKRMQLRDESDAIGELLKGKATTSPERHSGEGIFFTSKACDLFVLRSHRIELTITAPDHEPSVSVRKPIRGTEVTLGIRRATKRKLEQVFAAFAPEEYDFRFEKTIVTVRFSARDYLSRSEARRLVARLESFREVVLDFTRVRSIGQAFADEIFRVFAGSHPEVALKRVNVDRALDAVIRHVVDNQK
jgi:biotin operon repressor/anti-sigma regulatory factor (Ser/Thr protein kinase)